MVIWMRNELNNWLSTGVSSFANLINYMSLQIPVKKRKLSSIYKMFGHGA